MKFNIWLNSTLSCIGVGAIAYGITEARWSLIFLQTSLLSLFVPMVVSLCYSKHKEIKIKGG